MKKYTTSLAAILFMVFTNLYSNNGYDLWLNYKKVNNSKLKNEYLLATNNIKLIGNSETISVIKEELSRGLFGLLGLEATFDSSNDYSTASLVIATKDNLPEKYLKALKVDFSELGNEGYTIQSVSFNGIQQIVVSGNSDVSLLYGAFNFLRLMQTHQILKNISVVDAPKIDLRMLNHWDNLDRSVERGFAGFSLWNWQNLPEYKSERYKDYARANASIGINGTALNNVNANSLIFTPMYLEKVKALADIFRPYGIKVYLSAKFSSPMQIGNLTTADPLDADVQKWWKDKAEEIYDYIPDFGGFLVKANSEGQPGPQDYGRTHVDGANMLAEALEPYGGVVIWRAFVYSEHDITDRAKEAYNEFVPFDGDFKDNVIVQSKNGAIDFQPREPFHPMFGAMPNTSLMMEFQITQEYLGFSSHLVFLPKLFEEALDADTYTKGKGSTVAKVLDGSLNPKKITGITGVANTGTDINWTGHPFGQANWYGFGRLAWNPYLDADEIAEEWIKATYSNNEKFVEPIKEMMISSREAVVNYMMPLGLHHLFDTGHHYGPGPWVDNLSREDWNPVYYHKADNRGIGFNRSSSGSNAVAQYHKEVSSIFDNLETCPEEYLLWFHHVSWDYKMKNGESLWNNLAYKYQEGVNEVEEMISTWKESKEFISNRQYNDVKMLLDIQLKEAKWWKDACLVYFQTFSQKEFPSTIDKPERNLEYYKSLKFPFAPGIRPQWN